MKRSGVLLAAALLLLMAAIGLKGELLNLPDLRATSAPGEFDTSRALARLERILGDQRPHPVDSAANDAVRARLLAEMRAIGLEPQVTDAVACNGSARSRGISCARVRNVRATIGPAEGKHLLIASHYDSSPAGPGAADDGIGMASALEVAAHLARRPLARPVTFLFTDGEEAGLLGARAFLEKDPLADRVDSLINMEARGVTGPAIMFETSTPNAAAIAHFARGASNPSANSLNADFAKLIPNSTDVEVLKAKGWTILNFAIIANETRYHTPGDTLAALDPRSVQHMGDQVLALAADMAGGRAEASGTSVYADILGRWLVVLPLWAALAGLGLLLAAFAWMGWRRRAGLPRALAAIGAALIASALLTLLAKLAIGLLRAGEYWRAYPAVMSIAVDAAALLAIVAALAWIGGKTDRLRTAFWLLFLLLGAALALVAPGGSIFFLAPPLVALLGAAVEPRRAGAERAASLIAAILLFLTWAPLLHLSQALLDHDGNWIFAPVAALILLPVLIELKPWIGRPAVGGAAALAAIAWIAVGLAPAYSGDRKQAFGIEYAWDGSAGKASWLVVNDGAPLPDGFEGFEKGAKIPWSTRPRWAADARPGLAQPASLAKLAERRVGDGRLITLRLTGTGDSVLLRAPPEAALVAAGARGSSRRFGKGNEKDPYFIRCNGRSCDGMTIRLLIGTGKPVGLSVMNIRSGLPPEGSALPRARPANANPQYGPDASIAFSRVRI